MNNVLSISNHLIRGTSHTHSIGDLLQLAYIQQGLLEIHTRGHSNNNITVPAIIPHKSYSLSDFS